MQLIIQVAGKWPPAEGKKVGKVTAMVDGTEQSFEAWPDKLNLMEHDQFYEVEVAEREWNGRTIRAIKKVKPVAPRQQAPGRAQPRQDAPNGHAREDDEAKFIRLATALLRALWVEMHKP
jgi:hypothetical protein